MLYRLFSQARRPVTGLASVLVGGYAANMTLADTASCEGDSPAAPMTTPGFNTAIAAMGGDPRLTSTESNSGQPRQSRRVRRNKRRAKKRFTGTRPYPGKFDEMNKEAKETIDIQTWGGLRGCLGKSLFPMGPQQPKQVQAVFNTNITMQGPPGTAGHNSDMALTAQLGKNWVLVSNLTFSGRQMGKAIWKANKDLTLRGSFDINPQNAQYNSRGIEMDAKGSDYHISAGLHQLSQGMMYQASYLQSVTKDFAFGVQGMVRYPQVQVNYAGRYKKMTHGGKKGDILSLAISGPERHMVALHYARKVSEHCTLAAEFQAMPEAMKSLTAVGIRYKRPMFQFSGSLDIDGSTKSTLSYALNEMICFGMSGELAYNSKGMVQSQWGMSLEMGM